MARRKRDRKAKWAANRPAAPSRDAPPMKEPGPDRWRPWLLGGLCALFVLRPLYPSESAASYGDGLIVVMLWIALGVFWLLGAIGRRQFHVRFGWTDAAVLLLVALHTIAALWATARASPRPAVNMLWEWIGYGLCFLLARQLIVGRREARAVIVVMVALAVALAGYGLYQYGYELPATRDKYLNNPAEALREAGMWFEPGSRESVLFQKRLESIEPIGTFALTNSLAGYLAPWLVVTAGIGVSAGLSRARWRTRLAVLACSLPVAVCLILTKSRSAYVATALGLVLVGLFCREGKTRLDWKLPAAVVALGAILIAVVMVVGGLDAKVLSEASKSLGYRVQYWRSTLRMIADHPIAGCGPGNFQDAYTKYMLPEASEEIADPHNFLMEVWATAGTPAMLAMLAVLGCFGYALCRGHWLRLSPGASLTATGATDEADGTAYVFGGAACVFLLSFPIAQMSSAPPGIAAPLLGLPVALAVTVLLWRWVDAGPISAGLPAIGAVVLLVNLLAAGGLGFPGVGGTFWLLAAVGLNMTESAGLRRLPRSAALAALGVMIAMALTCSASAFNPVLRAQTAMREAQRDPRRAHEHLTEAAVADPLWAEPWRQLALLAFERWSEHPVPAAFDDFETSMETALDLAPNSAGTWRLCGDRYSRAFAETGRSDALRKAVAAYRRAVDLYPSSAQTVARLALALRAAGDEAGFQEQADAALRLDRLNPHGDKKLDDSVRNELRQGLSRSSSREN